MRQDVVRSGDDVGFAPHLRFFDRNGNDKISVHESYEGLRRLGLGILLAAPAAVTINFGVAGLGIVQGRPANPFELPLPKASFIRHPDTGVVGKQGDVSLARLEAQFREFGKTFDGEALTIEETLRLIAARLTPPTRPGVMQLLLAPAGLAGLVLEWGAMFLFASTTRQGTRVLEREQIRRFYVDPAFFYDIESAVSARRSEREKTWIQRARNTLQKWVL